LDETASPVSDEVSVVIIYLFEDETTLDVDNIAGYVPRVGVRASPRALACRAR
jgi:hypothetical protein